jgi:hypothetical protein
MFGKNTKIDHEADFKRIISKACSEAADAHVHARAIVAHLRSAADRIEQQIWQASYANNLIPKTYDGYGRPTDLAAKVEAARLEKQRKRDAADEIPPHLRQSAASGLKR